MSFRRSAVLGTVSVLSLLCPLAAFAECFQITAKYVMTHPGYELVFTGTVTKITWPKKGTGPFEMDRVWKGRYQKSLIYMSGSARPKCPASKQDIDLSRLAQRLVNLEARKGLVSTGVTASHSQRPPSRRI